ncbi:MAG: hypothetical protein WC145_09555 [Aliarcobacter sp.]
MFSEIIDFGSCCEENKKIDFLYDIFKTDFIDNQVYLENIFIDPKTNEQEDNKEQIFWHIITRKDTNKKTRDFDKERACRIKWIKSIIENYTKAEIKYFYYFEQSKKIRLYLWLHNHNFAVILQKLGKSSSYLVTSFYIDNQKKIDVFLKKFEDYTNKKDVRLNNCEWF